MRRADGTPLLIDGRPAEYDPRFQAAMLAFDPSPTRAALVAWWRRAAYVSETCRKAEQLGA
jgi:hypothetical protein